MLKKSCGFSVLAIIVSIWLAPAAHVSNRKNSEPNLTKWTVTDFSACSVGTDVMTLNSEADTRTASRSRASGIKEEIPDKFRARYNEWKKEFLSTEMGRAQWSVFERSKQFALTITVTGENQRGATTGKYKWNDSNELIGATIMLGSDLNQGYPDPVYYPVMNSLALGETSYSSAGDILAATKIAHEFGHVNQAAVMDGRLYQLQNQLMPLYKNIFLSNGHDTHDPRLVTMAHEMGGTSVEVWEDREYWGEANAMRFLRDRVSERNFRCTLFTRIKRRVQEYAESYEDRFNQVAQVQPSICGWS